VAEQLLRGIQLGRAELLSVAYRKINILVLGILPVTDQSFFKHIFKGKFEK
jgi:hypothetical protein